MKAIIIAMLAVQALLFLVTLITVVTVPARPGRRPVWSTFTIALVVASGASWNIGSDHAGQPGADILLNGSPLLLGMGIMAGMLLIRHRRGLDRLD
jgi:hypothetical protein